MKQKFMRTPLSQITQVAETPLPVPLRVDSLRRDPKQPRTKRNAEKLNGLAKTMKSDGQLQAIIVREVPGEDGHMIVIGEGRWLAAQINKAEFINCVIISESDPAKILAMQIIENIQREDMDGIDTAKSYRDLIALGICKNAKEVGDRVGVSDATVSVYLNILNAPPEIQELVEQKIATVDTARTLTNIHKDNPQLADSLMTLGRESGKLKRDVVRAAEAANKESTLQAKPNTIVTATVQNEAKANSEADVSTKQETTDHSGNQVPANANRDAMHTADQHNSAKDIVQGDMGTENKPAKNEKNAGVGISPALKNKAGAVSKPDGIVVVERFNVHVEVRKGAASRPSFDFNITRHGPAMLAHEMIHADVTKAWLHFGAGTDEAMLVPFSVADLVILKIVRQE